MRPARVVGCGVRAALVGGLVLLGAGCATVELSPGERTVTRKTKVMGPGFLYESETTIESDTQGVTHLERATGE